MQENRNCNFLIEKKSVKEEVQKDGKFGFFEGLASTFGNIDRYDDIIEKGAFKKSLQTGKSIKLLWQHNMHNIIGSFTEVKETDEGLYVKGRINLGTVQGQEALALLQAGDIDSMSIGFIPKDFAYNENDETRILKEIDLFEISLVTMPANEKALITAVKSIDNIEDMKGVYNLLSSKGINKKAAETLIEKIESLSLKERGTKEESKGPLIKMINDIGSLIVSKQ